MDMISYTVSKELSNAAVYNNTIDLPIPIKGELPNFYSNSLLEISGRVNKLIKLLEMSHNIIYSNMSNIDEELEQNIKRNDLNIINWQKRVAKIVQALQEAIINETKVIRNTFDNACKQEKAEYEIIEDIDARIEKVRQNILNNYKDC